MAPVGAAALSSSRRGRAADRLVRSDEDAWHSRQGDPASAGASRPAGRRHSRHASRRHRVGRRNASSSRQGAAGGPATAAAGCWRRLAPLPGTGPAARRQRPDLPEIVGTIPALRGPGAISDVVQLALKRAGITDAPSRGANLLRHSAATGMLRAGATLDAIGAVLRHRSADTTAHYAKVDVAMLRQIAQPWPGDVSC